MDEPATNVFDIEAIISHWIRFIGDGIDIFGVAIIVVGIAWSASGFLRQRTFMSIGVPAGLVVIRTVLSWTHVPGDRRWLAMARARRTRPAHSAPE